LQPIIEISEKLVDQYIQRALLLAESSADRLAIRLAFTINVQVTNGTTHLQRGVYVGEIYASSHKIEPAHREIESAARTVHSWRDAVLQEIHETLCTKKKRPKKLTGANKQSVDGLVTMIAVAVATHVGVAVPIIATLVAALLRFVLSIGISAFCKRFRAGLLFE
jgi:hypothetical protein